MMRLLLAVCMSISYGWALAEPSLAEKLYEVSGTERSVQRGSLQLLPAVDGVLRKHAIHTMQTRLAIRESDMPWVAPLLEKHWPTFLEEAMRITQASMQSEFRKHGVALFERFTPQEQQELLHFYQSPLGKKHVELGFEFQKQLEAFYMPGGGLERALQSETPRMEQWLRVVLNRPNSS